MSKKSAQAGQVNQNQYTTIDLAMQLGVRADMAGIGGGLAPISDANDFHNNDSGVYLDPNWLATEQSPEPAEGDKRQFFLRFKVTKPDGSHAEGFNAGLFAALAEGHAGPGAPLNWTYALDRLKSEVDAQMAEALQGQKP